MEIFLLDIWWENFHSKRFRTIIFIYSLLFLKGNESSWDHSAYRGKVIYCKFNLNLKYVFSKVVWSFLLRTTHYFDFKDIVLKFYIHTRPDLTKTINKITRRLRGLWHVQNWQRHLCTKNPSFHRSIFCLKYLYFETDFEFDKHNFALVIKQKLLCVTVIYMLTSNVLINKVLSVP